MASLSTHVLDTGRGRSAVGVHVSLESEAGAALGAAATDADGRVPSLGPQPLPVGVYRLRFDTAAYFGQHGLTGFYPEVVVTFTVAADEHYHVPLLLTPHGYTTYRGS